MASVKKLFFILLPTGLLGFFFLQDFLPLLRQSSPIGYQAVVAPVPAVRPAEKVAPVVDLKKLKQGVYYAFKADYTCFNPKNPTAPAVPSHFDSYGIADGKICHLGDVCNDSYTCSSRLPAGMTLAKNSPALHISGREFRWQETPYPSDCNMPGCSPPPDNCRYSVAAPLDEKGCAVGCGSMACKSAPESCPQLECAVPPANCAYDGLGSRDANNCPVSCGKIFCDIVGDETSCPKLDCAVPPENCRYDRNFKKDAKGCKLGCGNITCERPDPKKAACKIVECAMPPPGCNYEGLIPRDENGCASSCGSLACLKTVPAKCKIPKCDPAPVNCRYDGNSPLDFDGCSSGCGNLVCNAD